jgi:hypothetical protein
MSKKEKILKGLRQGEKAIIDKRLISHADAKKRMSRWLK